MSTVSTRKVFEFASYLIGELSAVTLILKAISPQKLSEVVKLPGKGICISLASVIPYSLVGYKASPEKRILLKRGSMQGLMISRSKVSS